MMLLTAFQSGYLELLDYLSAHVLTCLVPAFFIAGAIAVFVSGPQVLKYFGAGTKKYISYVVASLSGVILAVCSCTILPLFAGIYRKGAGLGPAVTFLYAGPAINLLAIVLTARAIGFDLGLGRAIGAVVFAIIIGAIMAVIYRKEEQEKKKAVFNLPQEDKGGEGWKKLLFFAALVGILLFGTAKIDLVPKLTIVAILLAAVAYMVSRWFQKDEFKSWMHETWRLTKLIVPVLLVGVFIAGMLKALVPQHWIAGYVGGNSLQANFLASFFGALMYFSTLTEVPIIKALVDMGMGKGPALALLLAGPALSLPNMLVIRNIMGTQKTLIYVSLVVVMATLAGLLFGTIVG